MTPTPTPPRRLAIGLDFDGVITDSRAQKHDLALARYGADIPTPVFKWQHAINGGLLTPAQYRDVQASIHYSASANRDAPFLPGLADYLPMLVQQHDVRIVTGRDGDALHHAGKKLSSIDIRIPRTGVGHNVSKRDATRGLDIFVDDDLDKLADLEVPHRILMSHEYNLHEQLPAGIARVHSWQGLYDAIETIAGVTR